MRQKFITFILAFIFAIPIAKSANYELCISVSPGSNGGTWAISLKNNTSATILTTALEMTITSSNPAVTISAVSSAPAVGGTRVADVSSFYVPAGGSQVLVSGTYSVPSGTSGTTNFTMSDPYIEINGSDSQPVSIVCSVLNVVLPLNLLNFAAEPKSGTVALNWQTANEENMDYFETERSQDGKTFAPLSKTAAKNGKSQSYQTVDDSPYSGLSYYRLKMMNRDGTSSYSKIQSVQLEKGGAYKVYPNPVGKSGNILVESPNNEPFTFSLFDLSGREILTERFNTTATLNSEKLAHGFYMYKIQSNSSTQTGKIIIE